MPNKDIAKTGLELKSKRTRLVILLLLFVALLFIIGLFWLHYKNVEVKYDNVKIGNQTFRLEIASTAASRQKGLSDRASLNQYQGMLFDFNGTGNWRLWMINMHFDIDMAWLAKDGQIIYIKTNATPASYPETFGATKPSRYVIEVPAFTFNRLGVKEGDTIKIP